MDHDHGLLDAWAAGDSAAGRRFWDRYGARVTRFFARKVEPDTAADLVQQTFLKALDAWRRGHEVKHVAGWLFGVARNVLHDALRGRMRDLRFEPVRTSHALLGTRPSTALAQHQSHRRLVEALAHLSPDDQLALELFYWEDLSMAQVGEALGVTRSAAINRLYRARMKLREKLDPPS